MKHEVSPSEVDAAVAQTITAEGWRRHPAWGTDPGKAEAVATFGYTLVEEAVRPATTSSSARTRSWSQPSCGTPRSATAVSGT
jgi:hypothetical protein